MKNIFHKALPINIFQILGTTCCGRMAQEFAKKNLSKHSFCYDATSFFAANMLVIWGSVSQKLSLDLAQTTPFLLQPSFILHIQGCPKRVQNDEASSDLRLNTHRIITNCHPHPDELAALFSEVRSCFKA